MVDEESLEKEIEVLVLYTLKKLQECFIVHDLSDRQATLSLYYFIKRFVLNGWAGHDPVVVLKNIADAIKKIDK